MAETTRDTIDYAGLLRKYITFVYQEEGSHFLYARKGYLSCVTFTDEEWTALRNMTENIEDTDHGKDGDDGSEEGPERN